jgi:hypothetical protein
MIPCTDDSPPLLEVMACTTQKLEKIAHAKSVTFQDRCDAERQLADVLHEMAARRRYNAYDLEQEAFMQRLHSAQLSGLWTKVEDVEDDEYVLEVEREHTRIVQDRIKSITSELKDLEKFLDDPHIDTAPSQVSSIEQNPPSGTGRAGLALPKKRKHASRPIDKAPSRPKIKCDEETPIQNSYDALAWRRCGVSGSGWACINGQAQNEASNILSSTNGFTHSTDLGLMQFTDRRDWKEGRLIQRKARKLGRLHHS